MATFHLFVNARSPRRPVAGSQQYESVMNNLAGNVDTAIGWCVAPAAWLRPTFPAGCLVDIQLRPYDGDELLIEKPRSRNPGGVKVIICPVGVPVRWFAGGGHAVPAVRLLRAVLEVLDVVGTNFGVGPPHLRSRAPGGKPAPADPFSPPISAPSPYVAAGAELDRMARAAGPGQLLAARRGQDGRGPAKILNALGDVETESVLGGTGRKKVRVWTVRMRS